MSERQALLAAILAEPDDDTVRLAFADWLDENGDENDRARAMFIRIQCDANRHEPRTQVRDALEREAWRVRNQHGEKWGSELEGVVVSGHTNWSRGFVDEVMMYSKRFVADGARVFASQPVRSMKFVDLGARGAVSAETLLACPHLSRLRTLQFVGDPLNDSFAQAIRRSGHLSSLVCLRLKRGLLSPKALRSILEAPSLPNLRELSIGEHGGSRHLAALAASASLARLKTLECWRCVVDVDGARALARSKHASGLETLRITHDHDPIGHSPLRGPGAVALAESPHLRGLKSLALEGQELRKKGLEAFARSYSWTGLQRLSLRSNGIPASSLPALAENPALRSLEHLDLEGNKITAADIEPLRRALPRTMIMTDDIRHQLALKLLREDKA